MKKIAILSFYRGFHNRGVESWVTGLHNNLSKNFEVKIFQNFLKDEVIKVDKTKNHESKILKYFFLDYWSVKILFFNLKIIPSLVSYKPNIVLATDGGWESRLMRIFTWLTRSKLVIVGQSGVGFDDLNNLYAFPDRFVALSEKALLWSKKANPFIQITKIPNAVDTSQFYPKTKSKNKYINIISVGALEKGKRMDLIIRAASKVNNAKLTIIGEGLEKPKLNILGKKLLKNRLIIKSLPHEDLPSELQKSDLFISASESWYSFEIVLLEAMATNLPVIANHDEVRREIIGKAGYLCNPQDTNDLANLILKVSKKNWRNIPRKQAELFSWKFVTKEYTKLFKHL